jgi:plasmid stability protein
MKSTKKYLWLSRREYISHTNRHLPRLLHQRLKTEAARRGHTLEKEMNICLDLGLTRREREREEK